MSRMKDDHISSLTFPLQHPGILPTHILLLTVFLLLFSSLSFTLSSYILEPATSNESCLHILCGAFQLKHEKPASGSTSKRGCVSPHTWLPTASTASVRGGVPRTPPHPISSSRPPGNQHGSEFINTTGMSSPDDSIPQHISLIADSQHSFQILFHSVPWWGTDKEVPFRTEDSNP